MIQVSIYGVAILLGLCSATEQEIKFPSKVSGSCYSNSGRQGWCLELQKCRAILRGIPWGRNPTHCGFKGKTPIVCCPFYPDRLEIIEGKIIHLEVQSPSIDFECGRRSLARGKKKKRSTGALKQNSNTDIFTLVGGVEAIRNSWPWMALLGKREEKSSEKFFCSGVLINERYVITAAHCVLDPERYFVRLGEHDYRSSGSTTTAVKSTEDINVENIIFHPEFDLLKGYHDVALLKLSRNVRFRNEVSPICLPWESAERDDLVNETVTVAGWGKLGFEGPSSAVLNEVQVTVFEPSVCEKSYSTLRNFEKTFPEGMNRDNIICAGDRNGMKDSCQGDSGGPMMDFRPDTNSYSLAGIISKGYGCGLKEFPGLYSPIRNLGTLTWIKDAAFSS